MVKKKKKLSLKSSSGSGYNYEHIIQSELIIDWFYTNNYFNMNFLKSSNEDEFVFQARNLGFQIDDLLIKSSNKNYLFQITEETITYSSGEGKFKEFIKNAYIDYQKENNVEIILVKSSDVVSKDKIVFDFLTQLKKSNYENFIQQKKNNKEKEFISVINKILEIDNKKELYDFLKTITIITKNNTLDFNIDYSNLIKQNLKLANYEQVVTSLKDFCFNKSINGETINFNHINDLLSNLLNNKVNELNKLLESSQNQVNAIKNKINNLHIERTELFNSYIENEKQINIIYGEPGIGKSAFIKTIYNSHTNQYKFFIDGEIFFKENINLNPIKEINNVCDDILLIIDSVEKVFENNTFNFVQFLKEIKNINIILVTRKYSIDKVKEILLEADFNNDKNIFEVPEITDEQLNTVLMSNSISITNKQLKNLLKNVFYLNNIINYSIILENEKNIVNEYKIKEKIFDAITESNPKYKNAMISVFEKKHKISSENYINFLEEIKYLIDKNIIIEHFGNYYFSHDKYDDLVLFYILESNYNNNLENLLINYKHNILMLRGLNVWLKDKIINNKKEITNQIFKVLKNQNILMLYKSEIIKILYEQKIIIDFLNDKNLNEIFNDIYLFNLIISSTLIIDPINIISDKDKRHIATFDFLTLDEYIIPNRQYLDILAKIISSKKDLIKHRHIEGIMRILKSICKHTKINNELIYSMSDYYSLFKLLIPFFEDYELNDLFKKEFLDIYFYLCTYDIENAKNTIDKIINLKGNRHKLSRLELNIMDSLKDLEKGSLITSLYVKNFYKQICFIILDLSLIEEKDDFYNMYEKNPYKIKDTHTSFPSALSNQLYFALKENPKETFVIINDFLNRITKNYSDNQEFESFEIEIDNKTIKIPLDINQYSGYRGFGNLPNILKVILMAMERFLLFDLKDKEKDFYLNELLTKCSSLMQISIVCSVIKSEPEKQFTLLMLLAKNKYILSFDLNCTIHEMTSLFMYNDPFNSLNQAERKKSSEIYNRKKSLWDILLDLQSNNNYNEKIWELFEELKPQLGNSEDDMVIKKRIHDFDIRNYVPVKEVERDGKNYIEFLPKENDDKEIKEFLEKRDNTEYTEHILLEQHIKKILDKEEKNDLTIQDLHKEYNKVNRYNELSVFDDYLLILVLNMESQNFSEKLFKNKVKKIIISKLKSEKTIGWERTYREYLIQLVPTLYNHWTKDTMCNFLIHCLRDSHSHEDYIKSICSLKESEPKIYKKLIKMIKNKKNMLGEADFFSLILKISNKDNFNDFEDEINASINYISIDDRTHQDYTLRHSLSNFLISNINDKMIRNLISNIVNSDKPNYELIEEFINESISLVDSRKITIENFWEFIESTALKISQNLDNNSPEKYVSRSSSYIRNNYYYNENQIIRLILLDYPYWNQKTHKWQPLENNSIYIKIAKMFAHLPVGLSAIMRTMWQFRDNLPPKTLLEFANIIEKNSNVTDYFSDRDTQFILEFLITSLYNKGLETLNENELLKLSNIIMNFVLCTSSYKINYIYQQLLPSIYK